MAISDQPELPIDVAEVILLRLQVQDLVRCQVVSKAWGGLIKSFRFIKKHLLLHQSNNNNIIVPAKHNPMKLGDDEIVCLSSPCGRIPYGRVGIVGSCNGLLCFISQLSNKFVDVWNPAATYWKAISVENNVCALGFGYDATTGYHKAVKILSWSGIGYSVEVWNVHTDCWRRIDSVLPKLMREHRISCWSSLFLRGNLYWLGEGRYHGNDTVLICFDVCNETFRLITVPEAITVGNQVRDNLTNEVDFIWLYCCCMDVGWRKYFGLNDSQSDHQMNAKIFKCSKQVFQS